MYGTKQRPNLAPGSSMTYLVGPFYFSLGATNFRAEICFFCLSRCTPNPVCWLEFNDFRVYDRVVSQAFTAGTLVALPQNPLTTLSKPFYQF